MKFLNSGNPTRFWVSSKTWKVMKLTFALLTLAFLQVSAEGNSQTVTFSGRNVPLKKVLTAIKKQTGFFFFYDINTVKELNPVTIQVANEPLKSVLEKIVGSASVTWTIEGKTISFIPRPRTEEIKVEETAAPVIVTKKITGKVTNEKGEPLVGATVQAKGVSEGVYTKDDGSFAIEVSDKITTLIFSYVGMEQQEIVISNQTAGLQVVLKQLEQKIDDLVVVGYGTQRKKDLTGAVTRTNLKSKGESPAVSLATSLQGVVPGLNVGAVTRAGTDPVINIRGRVSLSGSNSPLIILDGIIYRGNLVDINPADIESVDVLKDASATAVYGSQASNGVIILSSRQGKNKRPTVEYSTSFSVQSITNKDMLPENGAGFIRRIGDRFLSESRTGPDLLTPNPAWDPTSKFFGPEILAGYQKGVETNWWDLLTNKSPMIQNHNISVTGKNDALSYYLSFGHTNQTNVVKGDDYKRNNFRINLETKLVSWFKMGLQSFFTINDYSGASPSIGDVVRLPPQVPYADVNGAYIRLPYRGTLSPFLQTDQQDVDKRNNLFATIYADINVPFINGLNYRVNFSPSSIGVRKFNFNSYDENFTGSALKTNELQYSQTLDHILNYRKTFNNHTISATLLYGSEKITFEGTTAKSIRFSNNVLGYNFLNAGQAGLQTATSAAWQESSLYSMARVSYGYKGRYLLTGTVRRDGFSGFGENNKYGIFPSAAFAWKISDEEWMKKNVPVINDLKLRVSYGVNGNRTVGRYQTLAQIRSGVNSGYLYGDGGAAEPGQLFTSLANPNLKWETTRSLNLGLDFSLLKDKLFGSIDYYNSKTFDLLYNVDIPVVNGFNSVLRNIGKLANNGIELSLTAIPVSTKKFTWSVTGNFSRNRNQVQSILGIDANNDGIEDDIISSKLFIGKPYGVAYDFNIIGMWQLKDHQAGTIPSGFSYGTYRVEDIDKSGTVNASGDRKILGYTDPSYRFSIQNTLSYKDFELKIFVNSIQGGKNYYLGQPGATLNNPDNAYGFNFFKWDYWTPENPNARYRQIGFYSTALGGSEFSPYIKRSFVRLQDVTLSYNLPSSLLNKVKLGSAKVFINGANLLTFSDWDGWDPETGTGLDFNAYPFLKSFTVGLNIKF